MREKARVTIQQLREFGHHAAASPPLMATGHKDLSYIENHIDCS